MLERTIKRIDDGFVVYAQDGRRLDAYLTAGSAERAVSASLRALGGGTIVRVDGTRVTVPSEEPVPAG